MLDWQWYRFADLSPHDLYAVLHLRAQIFVIEQQCIYLDPDNQDQHAMHLLCRQNQQIVAYARVLPSNEKYPDWVSIGRIITHQSVRGQGLGKELVARALAYLAAQDNQMPVVISAQFHLKEFYMTFGFTQEGQPYDEDGIDHIKMRLKMVTP